MWESLPFKSTTTPDSLGTMSDLGSRDQFEATVRSLFTRSQPKNGEELTIEPLPRTSSVFQSSLNSPATRSILYTNVDFAPQKAVEIQSRDQDGSNDSTPADEPLSHISDGLNRNRQQAAVASDRFQAFVADNLGSYAPTFIGKPTQSTIQPGDGSSSSSWTFLHSTLPDTSSPRLQGEVSMESRSTTELEKHLANLPPDDLRYLKDKGKGPLLSILPADNGFAGAFELPPRKLQEDLIDSYFTWINPTLPVIDRTWFLNEFQNNRVPSLLILFAMFTAACKVCSNVALMDKWGTNLESGRHFYTITKVSFRPNVITRSDLNDLSTSGLTRHWIRAR